MKKNMDYGKIICFFIVILFVAVGIFANFLGLTSNLQAYAISEAGENEVGEIQNVFLIDGSRSGNVGIMSGSEIATLALSDLTNVKYIENANYFLINPWHHENDENTGLNPSGVCTTVALQLLMGYHNYYSDRRIIPASFLATDYGDLEYHPAFNRNRVSGQGCQKIGTTDSFFHELYGAMLWPNFPGLGQAIGLVKDTGIAFMNNYTDQAVRNNISLTSGFFSKATAQSDIDSGNPIVLGMHPFNNEQSFHVVIAYGYAKLDGEDGFLVHYGWGDSRTQVWVPSSWFAFQMRMIVNSHTHSYVQENIHKGTHMGLLCTICDVETVDNLYSVNILNDTITGINYLVSNQIVVLPYVISKYNPNTASFTYQYINTIGNHAFFYQMHNCQVYILSNITRIGIESFNTSIQLCAYDVDRYNIDFVVPEGMTSIYIANGWTGFNFVEMSATGPLKVISGQLHDKVEIPTFFNNRLILTIDELAFAGQTYITEMILPSTITKIESSAFYNCTNLLKINFISSNNLTDVPDHSTSYTNYWYTERCMNVNLEPDTVYTLSFDYSGLTASCDIGNVFTSLGVGANTFAVDLPVTKAFAATSGKQEITFIPTASQLSSSNKLWCRFIRTGSQQTVSINIKKVIVEKGVTDIAIDAFTGCTHLYSPGLSFTLCDDGDSYWYSVSQGNMTSQVLFIPRFLPNSGTPVSQIAASGFANNENIRWVFMQSGLDTIGNRAFQFCKNLQKVNMSATSVERIEAYTFDICKRESDPNHIHNYHSSATNACALEDFLFPNTLEYIGEGAFIRTGASNAVTFPNGVTEIGDYAFADVATSSLYNLPSALKTIGDYAFSGNGSTLIKLDNLSHLESIGECAFMNTTLVGTTKLPASLSTITDNAFYQSGFYNGKLVIDGNGLSIGMYAFMSCNLSEIIITNHVAFIDIYAFCGNSSRVTYIEIGASMGNWEAYWNIGDGAFPVFRSCTLSSDKSYVVSFVKESGNPTAVTSSTATPTRKNHTFGGWYTTSDFSGTQYMDVTTAPNGTLYAKWTSSSCIAEGSLITLADGSQVAVENLTGDEDLLVWNMLTGQYDTAPILFIDSDPLSTYEVITLTFSDNTQVKVIYEHAFFDMTTGEYVFLRNDAAQYIGHYFNKQSGNAWTTVQLTNVSVGTEYTTAWSPVTYGHLCYYVNGMLTMPGATEGFINIFDVDTTLMQYDEEQMEEDILTYGLYTYEEFNAIIPLPELVFNAFNGQYLKVSIGKGLITLSEIGELLDRYSGFWEN